MLKIVMKCQCCRQAKNLFPSLYPKANSRDVQVYSPWAGALSQPQGHIYLAVDPAFFLALSEPISFCLSQTEVAQWDRERCRNLPEPPSSPAPPTLMLFDFEGAGGQENPPKNICSFQRRSGIVWASWRRLWSLKRFLQPLWPGTLLPTINSVHLSDWVCFGASPG